ncbi:MAG: deoxyguanosinetriphosphate triphosphohydrolase, partial [Clostridia bacterium]|nr:deoxyguanosinetriphosphate triphosphohydrolase [Clostridia bacterium]
GKGHGERINAMVSSVVEASTGKKDIKMTDEVGQAMNELRDFLFDAVYRNPVAKGEEVKARSMLAELYDYYVLHPQEMPQLYYRNTEFEPVGRCVCDFISGMTDRYAIDIYKKLFIPGVWQGINE